MNAIFLFLYSNQGPTIKTFCYEILQNFPDGYCDVGHISFTDLKSDERQLLLDDVFRMTFIRDQWSLAHGDSIYWGFSEIYTLMDYKNGELSLQNSKCGKYGMPFIRNEVPIYCPTNECSKMCLTLNITREEFTRGVVTVEQCSDRMLNIFRPLLAQYECPPDYYRMEFSHRISASQPRKACYSIQMFNEPIPIQKIEPKEIIENTCKGKIMPMKIEYDMFLFMQMSREIKLSDGNQCLFGLTTNNVVKYVDWDDIDLTQIAPNNFKWDESMNYNDLTNDSYLAVNSNGLWTWATSTVSCVVCRIDYSFDDPTILLKFDFLGKEIKTEITNQDNLFRAQSSDPGFICFALVGEKYVSNLTVFPVAYSRSNYVIQNVGDGRYWCLGHTIYTEFIFSNIYDAYGMVFVFVVVRKCPNGCSFSDENDSEDLNAVLEQNYKFVKILNSAVVHNNITIESDKVYRFIAHVRLVLQDDAIVDTNLISPLTQR